MAADAVAGETGSAEFGMLGPLLVTRVAGIPLPLGGRQQKAVLALLLAEAIGSVVSVGRLADGALGRAHSARIDLPRRCRPTSITCGGYWSQGRLGVASGEVLVTGQRPLSPADGQ